MASVSIDNSEKRFDKIEVIHDISFGIADGDFVVLVGPSGRGKSTLLLWSKILIRANFQKNTGVLIAISA